MPYFLLRDASHYLLKSNYRSQCFIPTLWKKWGCSFRNGFNAVDLEQPKVCWLMLPLLSWWKSAHAKMNNSTFVLETQWPMFTLSKVQRFDKSSKPLTFDKSSDVPILLPHIVNPLHLCPWGPAVPRLRSRKWSFGLCMPRMVLKTFPGFTH